MASTYSNIKIQLMATGENSGTWGNVTNVNLGTAIEQAMVETATVTFASANVTLSLTDTNAAQDARALRLNLTGTTGGARDLIVPAIQKPYIVNNGTADTITVKVSGQTGIAVPASKTMLVYNNGTDVVDAINHLSALSLGTALPIASGGTGSTSTTYANLESNVTGTLPVANGGTSATTLTAESVVVGNGTSAVKFVAPGTDGNVLTSNGTSWISEAPVIPQGVPTGSVMAFAGDPGAGWLECNGQIVDQSTYSDLYSKVGLLTDAFQTTSYTVAGGTVGQFFISNPAFGNSTYVIGYNGDNSNRIYTSTDALTWTARSVNWITGMLYPRAMLYTDKFVAGWVVNSTADTNGNKFATSTDGITWTVRTVTSTTSHVNNIAYNGSNTYVASFAGGNTIATSTDGVTWTARTPAVTDLNNGSRVAYGNGVFVLAGGSTGNSTRRTAIQTSTDGITWTFRSVGWNFSRAGYLNYVNNKFWLFSINEAGGSVAVSWTSTDGITWAQNTTLSRYVNPITMTYDSTNSLLMVYGRTNAIYASIYADNATQNPGICVSADDGVTWQLNEIGVDVTASTTTSVAPVNSIQSPEIYTNGTGGLNYINNIIILNGAYTIHNDTYPLDNAAYLRTITSGPYTYQTDTQFAIPTARIGTTYNYTKGLKSSLAAPITSVSLKYYIKT